MDYSLLIGIHDVLVGNTEGIRDNKLHIVSVRVYIYIYIYRKGKKDSNKLELNFRPIPNN